MLKLIIFIAFVVYYYPALTAAQDVSKVAEDTVIVAPIEERIICRANQTWDSCPSLCPTRTCKNKDLVDNCLTAESIKPGGVILCQRPRCRCADNFYLTDDGRCVKKEDCPIQCGLNEVPSECGNNPCIATCDTPIKSLCAYDIASCKPGCVCAEGYIRDRNNTCIPKDKCPKPQCGLNEVPSDCANNQCLPTCARPDLLTYCRPNLIDCKPGCVCAQGYIRDANGICIPREKCPNQCKDITREYSTCPNRVCRPKYCKEVGYSLSCNLFDTDIQVCERPRCICIDGYVENELGVCVPIRECPACGGDRNAWSGCGFCNRCNKTQPCPRICLRNGCECREGFLYDDIKKICVRPDQCPPQCGLNEVPSDCATNTCLPTCAQPYLDTYCKPNPDDCKPGCVCAEGFVRDANGTCILREKCPFPCKKNQELSTCPNRICRPKNCKEVGYPLKCNIFDTDMKDCELPRCICRDGYVENQDGVCVPVRECPSCAGDVNAWSGCGFCNRCNKTQPCLKICVQNGCECREGFLYDDIKKMCVRPDQCPPQCGNNEVPSDCATNPCLPSCAQPDLNTYCRPNPAVCKPGCVCAEGYIRDENFICIPKGKCPPPQCGLNEVPSDCATNPCIPSCAQPYLDTYCRPNPAICKPGCVCAEGYIRDENFICIPKEKCPPPRCSSNEVPSDCATNPCLPTCAQPYLDTYCRPNPAVCKPGCVCAEGYIRDANGICIPKEKCPPTCKENEEYVNCTNQVCRPQTCKEVGFPLACQQIDQIRECGKPGCVCQRGFVRDENNVCISARNCTSCGGDDNAWYGCGTYCKRCSNYNNQYALCPLICLENTCDCRPDLVYDEINKRCVKPEECPPLNCGRNEVPSDCANSPCIRNCATYYDNLACRPYPPGCKRGCVCEEGYIRDDNNICIPLKMCQPKDIAVIEAAPVKA